MPTRGSCHCSFILHPEHLSAIWLCSCSLVSLGSLLEYVGQKAVQMFDAAGIRCRIELPDRVSDRQLNAEFRHHYFLMVQEAQNNAAKHSDASEITLKVEPQPECLITTLEDNGCGFNSHAVADESLSDGLRNLTARAAALNGTCQIV